MTGTPHTPTPWGFEINKKPDGGAHIVGPNGNDFGIIASINLARVSGLTNPRPEGLPNAAFIVRAVNAHDDLVKALALAETAAASMISTIEKFCDEAADRFDVARKLNDQILEFRRAHTVALSKAGIRS